VNQYHKKINKPPVLYVGSHLPKKKNYISAGEIISTHLSERGWQIILTSRKEKKFFRLLDMLWVILSKRNAYKIAIVDVFSGPSFYWAFSCGQLLKIINKPFILVLRGGNLPGFSQSHPNFVSKLFSWAAGVTSPSGYLQEKLKSFRDDINLIPNGIAINEYPVTAQKSSEKKLVWLRAFHKIYNPSLLIKVILELLLFGYKPICSMIGPDRGDGSLQEVQHQIMANDLSPYIEIIPGVNKSDVPKYLSRSSIFINTTNVDNTPVSVIEAMACGLCVISTNVGGMTYLLEDEIDALLVPPNDSKAITKAIIRIFSDNKLACKLSSNARIKAESFSWKNVIPLWERQLFTVMRGQDQTH